MKKKAVFLDRDGVINFDYGYVHEIDAFEFIPGSVDALKTLQDAGFALVIVTNQAGIGRGLYSNIQYRALNNHMQSLLATAGVELSGIYYCPHHPDGVGEYRMECACRKPKAGMLKAAAVELGIDPRVSVMIGDKISDIEAGRTAGCRYCILVESGHAVSEVDRTRADVCLADLRSAASWILKIHGR